MPEKWEMTEDELVNGMLLTDEEKGFARIIAKAAQKNLVEWLSSPCKTQGHPSDPNLMRVGEVNRVGCWDCWQALRESVGLE